MKLFVLSLTLLSILSLSQATTSVRYALDDGLSGVYLTVGTASNEIYDVHWTSDEFLGFGYHTNGPESMLVSFNMSGLKNNPSDAYLEFCQIQQVGSHPWASNPWCAEGPCLRVISKGRFGLSAQIEEADFPPPSSLQYDALDGRVEAFRQPYGKIHKTGRRYQIPLDPRKLVFNGPDFVNQFIILNNGHVRPHTPNRRGPRNQVRLDLVNGDCSAKLVLSYDGDADGPGDDGPLCGH